METSKTHYKFLGICYTNNISRFDALPTKFDIFCINKKLDNFPLRKDYSSEITSTFENARMNIFTKFIHGMYFTFKIFKLSKKYDAFVFITPPYFHFLNYPILKLLRKKTITMVADAYYYITKDKSFDNYLFYLMRKILSPLYFIQEYISIRFSSAVFTNSFFLYEVHKKWNNNTFYTPNGADVKTICNAKIKKYVEGDYIIYIGSFSPFRGVDSLISAFKILKESYKRPIKLVLMGKLGEQEKYLKNIAGEEKDIIFAGYIPIPEVYSYVKGAKLGVISNKATITSHTISSNKGFIYIAADVPQIVTDSGDHSYWTNKLKTGLVVKSSAQDLATGMLKLLTDKKLYLKFKNNCKSKKNLVDYPSVKEPLIKYLNELAKN